MFDVSPEDQKQRFLLNHPESDSLFEVFTEAEKNQMCDSPNYCDDVTDIPHWEAEFKKQKEENNGITNI